MGMCETHCWPDRTRRVRERRKIYVEIHVIQLLHPHCKPPRTGHTFTETDEPRFSGPSRDEGEPEESEPSTSTDDDSSLGGQEQIVAPV
jgi:hypothetical protein